MGSARKFLDLHFDFFVFVMGLALLMANFMRVYKMQEEQFKHAVNGNNSLVYVSGTYEDYVPGADIVLYLLGDDIVPVLYDGVIYGADGRMILVEQLKLDGQYRVKRDYMDGVVSKPSLIRIIEMDSGDGGAL